MKISFSKEFGRVGGALMKLVIQRCEDASVKVDGEVIASIGTGLMVLVGIHKDDTWAQCEFCMRRILNGRYFDHVASSDGKEVVQKKTVIESDLEILLVSQFTLLAKLKSGTRLDYHDAMNPDPAKVLFDRCTQWVRDHYKAEKVKTGQFGAIMKVSLTNDGPTTILIEKNANEPTTQPDFFFVQ